MNTVICPIYGTSDNGSVSFDSIHSHHIAVFFVVLASGVYYAQHPQALVESQQYHALARAALSIDPMMREATCATVQALFMIMRFVYISDRTSSEERWLLSGLVARVSQIVRDIYLAVLRNPKLTQLFNKIGLRE